MQQKITFSEACMLIAVRTGLPRRDVDEFLRALFAVMSDALSKGEQVRLKGIGSFRMTGIGERRSIDVNTGKAIILAAHTKLTFIPAKELAGAVNMPFAAFEAVELAGDLSEEDLEAAESGYGELIRESDTTEDSTAVIMPGNDTAEDIAGADNENKSDVKKDTADKTAESDVVTGSEPIPEVNVEAPLAPFISSDYSDTTYIEEGTCQEEEHRDSHISEETTGEGYTESSAPSTEESGNAAGPIPDTTSTAEDYAATAADADSVQYTETEDSGYPPMRHNSHRHLQRRHRYGFVIGFICALLLICIAGILILLLCPETARIVRNGLSAETETEEITQPASAPGRMPDTTTTAATAITDTTPLTAQAPADRTDSDPAPTEPSDNKKTYDVVRHNRYLITMAREHYGNQHLWPYIYEENKSFLGHPDRIKPGTRVVIPNLAKYGVDPANPADIAKAKKMEIEIYSRYAGRPTVKHKREYDKKANSL